MKRSGEVPSETWSFNSWSYVLYITPSSYTEWLKNEDDMKLQICVEYLAAMYGREKRSWIDAVIIDEYTFQTSKSSKELDELS